MNCSFDWRGRSPPHAVMLVLLDTLYGAEAGHAVQVVPDKYVFSGQEKQVLLPGVEVW